MHETNERPSHLWPCGCLRNEAGAHRRSCPDYEVVEDGYDFFGRVCRQWKLREGVDRG